MSDRPLHGVRVLDLSRFVAGPHATRMLADLGADVAKIEPPTGDGTRRWGKDRNDIGPYFTQQNCGKRSICVDLASEDGRALVRRLAAASDVLVENFRPGVMEHLGLEAASLRQANPRLIYASMTGFGGDGQHADRRAYANVVHAAAGLLERNARIDGRPPAPVRWSAADTTSALELLAGILAALYRRERTGTGDLLEVAMFDSVLSADDFAAFDLWDPDPDAPRPDPVLVATADGYVMISANPVLDPEPFVEAMGRPELLSQERFATRRARRDHRKDFLVEFEVWTATLPSDEVEERLHAAGLAISKLRHTREAVDWARSEPRPVIVEVDDRGGELVPLINSPQRFTEASSGIQGVAPYRGEHNRAIVTEWLRCDEGEVDRLESCGALVPADQRP